MGSLKEVRNRITSVRSTQQITRAMKVVSAAKLRKAQSRIVQMRPYALKLKQLLSNLAGSLEGSDAKKFYEVRPVKRVLLVIITSDRGLAGSFNGVVIKEGLNLIRTKYATQVAHGNLDVLTIGKKGRDFFKKNKSNIVREYPTMFANLTYESAEEAAAFVMDQFTAKNYDVVEVLYNQFKNAAVYVSTTERFLPIPAATASKDEKGGNKSFDVDYIFEPSKEEILSHLIHQSLKVNFFRALLESNAAEHGARMTAMDKATENAEELLRTLRLQYNKERQATITKEILEIVGGAQALNG